MSFFSLFFSPIDTTRVSTRPEPFVSPTDHRVASDGCVSPAESDADVALTTVLLRRTLLSALSSRLSIPVTFSPSVEVAAHFGKLDSVASSGELTATFYPSSLTTVDIDLRGSQVRSVYVGSSPSRSAVPRPRRDPTVRPAAAPCSLAPTTSLWPILPPAL